MRSTRYTYIQHVVYILISLSVVLRIRNKGKTNNIVQNAWSLNVDAIEFMQVPIC